MEMTKSNLRTFRTDLAEAVKELESVYEIKIELGSISYNESSFKTRLTVTNIGNNGIPESNAKDFPLYAKMLAVPLDWMNKEFMTRNGEKLRIIGLNPRRPKNAVELEGVNDGKKYRASVAYVNQFMESGDIAGSLTFVDPPHR